MKLLLDTHAWLWFVLGDDSLTPVARKLIEDPTNDILISPVAYWEIAIKISIGKYHLSEPFEQFIGNAIVGQGFEILPILPQHTTALVSLPFHHRDPFDRLLVAQALTEQVPLLSADAALDAYGVQRLW